MVPRKELFNIGNGFTFMRLCFKLMISCIKVWKSQKTEKSFQSSIPNWVLNLPFDTKIKVWLVEEEKYKQELNMKNILPAVADKFLTDAQGHRRGASILCFDEIQAVDVFAIVALSGTVSRLLSAGTVVVATSNRAPRDLNQVCLRMACKKIYLKTSWLEWKEHCENVLIGSEVDYRCHIAQSSIDQARTEPSFMLAGRGGRRGYRIC